MKQSLQAEKIRELEEVKKNLKDNQAASEHMIRAFKDSCKEEKEQTLESKPKESKKTRWKTILVNVGKAVEKREIQAAKEQIEEEMKEWLNKD